jgi:hypothetical protein
MEFNNMAARLNWIRKNVNFDNFGILAVNISLFGTLEVNKRP